MFVNIYANSFYYLIYIGTTPPKRKITTQDKGIIKVGELSSCRQQAEDHINDGGALRFQNNKKSDNYESSRITNNSIKKASYG